MKDKLWTLLSNPPMTEIDGIKNIPAWTIPDLKDRKAMVEAIVKVVDNTPQEEVDK